MSETERYLAAIVELTSSSDVAASVDGAIARVEAAADLGARLVALPEATSFLGPEPEKRGVAEPLDGPTLERFSRLAASRKIHLLVGSVPERSPDPEDERLHNTSVLFDDGGRRVAVYRKIHLFDADPGDGRPYRERLTTAPGDAAVVAETALGKLGLTVCYDLRFAGLYQDLADGGAEVFTVPSAFTVPTGQAHWEVLLRARAIEHQAYVLAPAQGGDHGQGRRTWGHGLIIDPDGQILAQTTPHAPVAWALIDRTARADARKRLPTHRHRRPYTRPDGSQSP